MHWCAVLCGHGVGSDGGTTINGSRLRHFCTCQSAHLQVAAQLRWPISAVLVQVYSQWSTHLIQHSQSVRPIHVTMMQIDTAALVNAVGSSSHNEAPYATDRVADCESVLR